MRLPLDLPSMVSLEALLGERLNITVLRVLSQLEGGMSGNGIARRLELRQSAVRKALERLVERGVVRRTDIGRTASYALDDRRQIVRRVVLPLFRAEAALVRGLQLRLYRVAQQLVPTPETVVLYGSVARATRTPGDVDLLVVVRRREDAEPIRAALLDAVRVIERRYQVPVHPLVMDVAELASRADEPLVASIASEGLLLVGRAAGPLRRMRRFAPPVAARRT